jgi:hypothetical protein
MLGVDRINRLLGQAKIISKNASADGTELIRKVYL